MRALDIPQQVISRWFTLWCLLFTPHILIVTPSMSVSPWTSFNLKFVFLIPHPVFRLLTWESSSQSWHSGVTQWCLDSPFESFLMSHCLWWTFTFGVDVDLPYQFKPICYLVSLAFSGQDHHFPRLFLNNTLAKNTSLFKDWSFPSLAHPVTVSVYTKKNDQICWKRQDFSRCLPKLNKINYIRK